MLKLNKKKEYYQGFEDGRVSREKEIRALEIKIKRDLKDRVRELGNEPCKVDDEYCGTHEYQAGFKAALTDVEGILSEGLSN